MSGRSIVTAIATLTDAFSGTANPLAAPWYNNSTDKWSPCQKTPGLCFGAQPTHPSRFDDSFALRAGFTNNHYVQAVVHLAAGAGTGGDTDTHEVEIHLRTTSLSGFCSGYEINMGFAGSPTSTGYHQFIEWATGDNAVIGDFNIVSSVGISIADGDVLYASIKGTTFTTKINGVTMFTGTSTTFATGDPGIGFFWRNTGSQNEFGFSSITIGTT